MRVNNISTTNSVTKRKRYELGCVLRVHCWNFALVENGKHEQKSTMKSTMSIRRMQDRVLMYICRFIECCTNVICYSQDESFNHCITCTTNDLMGFVTEKWEKMTHRNGDTFGITHTSRIQRVIVSNSI